MDETSFSEEIGRVAKNFGVRGQIFEDKTSILWDEFRSVPNENWKRACKSIVENDDRFPNIKRFKTVLAEVARYMQYKGGEVVRVACTVCDGWGLVTAEKYDDQKRFIGDYVFRCNCENGAYEQKQILRWEERFKSNGFILKDEVDVQGLTEEQAKHLMGMKAKAVKNNTLFDEAVKMFDGKVIASRTPVKKEQLAWA